MYMGKYMVPMCTWVLEDHTIRRNLNAKRLEAETTGYDFIHIYTQLQ